MYLPSKSVNSTPVSSSSANPQVSNSSHLSSESCILLTLSYLGSLQEGEGIVPEVLKASFHCTQSLEANWIQYYRKHKKMSESTFVQCQFIHFARVASNPVSGRMQITVSQQSLSEGLLTALQSLSKLDTKQLDFVIVIAVHQNSPIEFCILVANPYHAKWIMELQQSNSVKGTAMLTPLGIKLSMRTEILTSVRSFHKQLAGAVLVPFLAPDTPIGSFIENVKARSLSPPSSHVIEHRVRGPFTQQCNVGLYMLHRIINCGQLDPFQRIDFFVVCPSRPSLLSQVLSDIADSGLIEHLGIGEGQDEVCCAIKSRIVVCHPCKIEEMVGTIASHPNVLYLVIVKSAHITTRTVLHRSNKGDALYDTGSSDCDKILATQSNAILLYTSPHPYALQTNRSLIFPMNEIHWPIGPVTETTQGVSSGMQFCDILNRDEAREWCQVREDKQFEESVTTMCHRET